MTKSSYASVQIIDLFNDMAKTYGAVNLISSFGFSHLWRRKCVQNLEIKSGHKCVDLMCGMGEASSLILEMNKDSLQIEAVDFSPEMTKRCQKAIDRFPSGQVTIQTRNVFDILSEPRFDRICCSFGLKTFDDSQLRQFAILIKDLLKPGGRAAFVDIYVPGRHIIRLPYLFYIRYVIPLIGFLCLGNPDCYRCLAAYTEDFAQRDFFSSYLQESGLKVREEQLFFGCAKLYVAEAC